MQSQINYTCDILSASTNDLNQVSCTLEMVLENIFGFEMADLSGNIAEQEKARKLVDSYPVWREVLALVWQNLIDVRDKMAGACMTVENWRPGA